MTARRHSQCGMKGQAIAEGAAGLLILIPLLIMITYVILEASHAYFIWSALQQGARQAAHLIMSDPNVTSATATDVDGAIQADLQRIQIPNVINDIRQFEYTYTTTPNQFAGQNIGVGQVQRANLVNSVQVTVTYTSGLYGLPVFPDADVLHLSSAFKLQGSSTCNTAN